MATIQRDQNEVMYSSQCEKQNPEVPAMAKMTPLLFVFFLLLYHQLKELIVPSCILLSHITVILMLKLILYVKYF